MDVAKELACSEIDRRAIELRCISEDLWNHPEESFKEHRSCELISSFLDKEGYCVRKRYPLETSFIARYGKGNVTVGVCCEYDALPEIGHACGHNLIAETAIACALGVKAAIDSGELDGQLIIFGTPAEEIGGGKVEMIKYDVFDDCDACLMAHPSLYSLPDPIMLACYQFKIIFQGQSSPCDPLDQTSTLDACVACYTNISMLRQQLKPSARVHCVIKEILIECFVRTEQDEDMFDVKDRVYACAKAAALVTGCTVEFEEGSCYRSLLTNKPLIDAFIVNARHVGLHFNYTGSKRGGSTDMGSVSKLKPSIHPKFKINTGANIHTKGFADAALNPDNQTPTLQAAKSLAMTVVDVFSNADLLSSMKEDFNLNR